MYIMCANLMTLCKYHSLKDSVIFINVNICMLLMLSVSVL